jgi:hypothetical protein
VPSDLRLSDAAVKYWLFSLGNWTVCSGAPGPEPNPDLFRVPASDTLAWLDRLGLEVVVDSFHDDVHWAVALGYLK